MLVTKPAMTPVQELLETATSIRDALGVSLSPVVVNGLHPPVPPAVSVDTPGVNAARDYMAARNRAELAAVTALSESIDVRQLHAGHHVSTGSELVARVAGDLQDAIEDLQ